MNQLIQRKPFLQRLLTWWCYSPRIEPHPRAPGLHRWCLVSFVLVAVLFGYQLTRVLVRRHQIEADAIGRGRLRIDTIAERVRDLLRHVEGVAAKLASDIEAGRIDREAILQRLKEDAAKERMVFALGVVFQPHMYSPQQRLHAQFYDKRTDKVIQVGENDKQADEAAGQINKQADKLTQPGENDRATQLGENDKVAGGNDKQAEKTVEEDADYTDLGQFERYRWHLEPVLRQSAAWVAGVGGPGSVPYLNHGVPFFQRNKDGSRGRLLGVVHAALTLESLTYMLNKQYVGRLGSGFLLDRSGTVLAHPRTDYFSAGRRLQDVALFHQDEALLDVVGRMREGETGVRHARDPETGERVVHFFEPIESSDFAVGMTVFRYELFTHDEEIRRRLITLSLSGLGVLLLFFSLWLEAYHLEPAAIWKLAVVGTLGMLGVLGVIWVLALAQSPKVAQQEQAPQNEFKQHYVIDDLQSLRLLLDQQEARAKKMGRPPPLVIPTGVFVRSVEFEGSNNVKIAGLVWQRYHINDHKDLKRGIIFPGVAPDPGALTLEQASIVAQGEYEVISWNFRIVLRLELDYSRYPFDRQQIGVRVQHVETSRNILLAPDMDAYEMINTHEKPGLSGELVLPGWDVEGSYFSYEAISQNANFGIQDYARRENYPEYQFNILTKREIITPFLSHVFPIMVVAALLYAVLSSTSSDQDKVSVSGFSTLGVLETCGAFFFAIILVHIDMRTTLNTDIITYLECLHLILYFILLLVALDALMFTSSKPPPLIRYEENFLAKVLFWPTLVGLSLVVSLWFFY